MLTNAQVSLLSLPVWPGEPCPSCKSVRARCIRAQTIEWPPRFECADCGWRQMIWTQDWGR